MRIRTNCSREECIRAIVQAESEPDPRGKRAWHGWPLRFRVLRGFHKYFVTFLLRDRRAFTAGGPFLASDSTGTGKNSIGEEGGSKSGSRLRIYELWNVWSF
jgi:hypothetical protein